MPPVLFKGFPIMRISRKFTGLSLGAAAIVVGLAGAFFVEIQLMSGGLLQLRTGPVEEQSAIRKIQLDLKKQVQEWKDILLRGYKPDDLAQYSAQFHELETSVYNGASVLERRSSDPETRRLLHDFLSADKQMSNKYAQAYDSFVRSGFDPKVADKIVRGQDRAPTALLDQAAQRLNEVTELGFNQLAEHATIRATFASQAQLRS